MWAKNRFTRLPMSKLVKKYWRKFFIYVAIPISIIILALSVKFEIELRSLRELRASKIKSLENARAPSSDGEETRDTWRRAGAEGASIFSAYMDTRPEVVLEETFYSRREDGWALIRIIGILEVEAVGAQLTCYSRFDSGVVTLRPAVGVRLIARAENFDMRYSAAFVLCDLASGLGGALPRQVAFSASGFAPKNLGFVEIRYPRPRPDRFMAACVPSLHHGYDRHESLVEFVEFYRMMGVERFTFYNTSVSARVSQVLAHYQAKGLAIIVPWNLPSVYKFERNLRYNGIFAALNDCLYRNTMVDGFTYVVNVDLDEFIVPRKHEDFRQMMEYLDPDLENNASGVFIFRNVFFYLMYDDDPITLNQTDVPKLILESKTTRYEEIYSAYSRSKYIARGENVIEMGNHRVWQTRKTSFVLRTGETTVDPDIALSHHYRSCEVNELVCWLRETVVDRAAHKHTRELGHRVEAVLTEVFRNEDVKINRQND